MDQTQISSVLLLHRLRSTPLGIIGRLWELRRRPDRGCRGQSHQMPLTDAATSASVATGGGPAAVAGRLRLSIIAMAKILKWNESVKTKSGDRHRYFNNNFRFLKETPVSFTNAIHKRF